MELNKIELWKALTEPVEKGCMNCVHSLNSISDNDKVVCMNCRVLDAIGVVDGKWEWNGIK